jgi:hypothetical protein
MWLDCEHCLHVGHRGRRCARRVSAGARCRPRVGLRGRVPQRASPGDAATLAHIVSAIMFLSMAATIHIARSVDEILEDIRSQARVLLSH